jgi:hypothetical protein
VAESIEGLSLRILWHDKAMKPRTSEMIEGTEAFERFNNAMRSVIAVPHSVIKQRIEEHRKQAAMNPRKRGPKTTKKKDTLV